MNVTDVIQYHWYHPCWQCTRVSGAEPGWRQCTRVSGAEPGWRQCTRVSGALPGWQPSYGNVWSSVKDFMSK